MLQLLNLFVDICLLRRGPQHLPASPTLTALLLLAYGSLVAVAERLFGEARFALAWALASMFFVAAATYGLLAFRGLTARFQQTLAALAGCGMLYLVVYLPVVAALDAPNGQDPGAIEGLLVLAWVLLFFWGFAIEGSIYRHALNLSLPGGVLLAVILFAVATGLYELIAGSSG